jgi:hypothetical protein
MLWDAECDVPTVAPLQQKAHVDICQAIRARFDADNTAVQCCTLVWCALVYLAKASM